MLRLNLALQKLILLRRVALVHLHLVLLAKLVAQPLLRLAGVQQRFTLMVVAAVLEIAQTSVQAAAAALAYLALEALERRLPTVQRA